MKPLIIILALFAISCSPSKRINRIVKNHPELLVKDTIRVIDTLVIQSIKFDTIIKVNKDVSGVDSILNSFNDKIDSITKIKLGNDIKYYITERKAINDTLKHYQDDLEVLIWEDENGINVKVNKPEQEIIREIQVPYEKINVTTRKGFVWFDWLLIGVLISLLTFIFLKSK